MPRLVTAVVIALALVACGKKKPPPRPTRPTATAPRPTPDLAKMPVSIAVSKLAVFVAMADGHIEKRPLGSRAAESLAAAGVKAKAKPSAAKDADATTDSGASKDGGPATDARAPKTAASGATRRPNAPAPDAAAAPSNVIANGRGVRAMAAAAGGSLLAVTHEFAHGREVWLYNQATLSIAGRLGTKPDGDHRLLLSSDGKLLVAQGGNITLWDTESGEKLRELPAKEPQEVRMSADGSTFAIQQRGEPSFERPMKGGGHEWVMPSPSITVARKDGKQLHIEKDVNPLADYALTPDGKTLLVGHYSGALDVIPVGGKAKTTGGLLLAALAVSPDSKRAAVGSTDGFVHLVNLADPKQTKRLINDDQPQQMAFSHDGKTLYLITRNKLNVLPLP